MNITQKILAVHEAIMDADPAEQPTIGDRWRLVRNAWRGAVQACPEINQSEWVEQQGN